MAGRFPEFGFVERPPHAAEMLTFDSLGELLDLGIEKFKSDGNARYFFRGECAVFPDPAPSLIRSADFLRNENKLFQDAQNRVPALFANCPTTFDKLCQMQHYGFPTRLIDISTDLAMSWFMAVDGFFGNAVAENLNNQNGAFYVPSILVFRVPREREKFVDSDLVATLSNVARMKPEFNSGELRHEVAQDRADFREEFLLENACEDCSRNWMVYPRMSNPRVRRQKGAFILCGLVKENCVRLSRGRNSKADKMLKDARTGLRYPKFEWDPQKRLSDISICARFVPSQKYFNGVSEAAAGTRRTYRDVERIFDAVKKFRAKVFEELVFVGGGEADAYADDFKRQSDISRQSFS